MNNSTSTSTSTNITDSIINAVRSEFRTAATPAPAKGYKQVGSKYAAQIGIGNKKLHLGMFDTPEEATAAYNAARQRVQELREQAQLNDKGDAVCGN